MHVLRLVLLVAIAPLIFIQGCDSTSNETLPNSGVSLCIDLYELCIDPIVNNSTATGFTCSQGGCHAPPIGQDGFFLFNPPAPPAPSSMMPASAEWLNNFNQVEARTLNNNLLLSKATGNNHGGNKQINVGDLCYNAIAEWRSIPAPSDGSACSAVMTNCPSAAQVSLVCGL